MYSWEDLVVYRYEHLPTKQIHYVMAFSLMQADLYMDVCVGSSNGFEVSREDMRSWWRYKLHFIYPHYILPENWPKSIKRRHKEC